MNRTAVLKGRPVAKLATVLTAMLAASATLFGVSASAADYTAISKDVQILGQVLETATAPKSRGGRWEHGGISIEGIYLAGQGMVFDINLPGAHYGQMFGAPLPPMAPLAPMPALAWSGDDDEDAPDPEDMVDTEEMESVVEEAMSAAQEAMSEMGYSGGIDKQTQEQFRALRDSQRKAARDYRDQQRAYADAVRKKKDLSQADKDKLKANLEKSRQSFEAAQQQFRTKAEALRNDQKQKWAAKLQETENQLLDALCNYAGSTRRLGAGEAVSFVLRDASGDSEAKHKIWVIKKTDLDACASGNQTAGVLQKKAISYNF
ncbi:hypothetical protein HPT27_08180 [Permianibacter sp. IMCC34836]|uniref:hypothetical protein n=1 Tax=Permianibacter fluminis TaxID=2738515 RepID=UPI0015561A35|nr:hypothetical protein [Permianibacter fluminis]NQD37000.1 hypothetical protein [Permianibacter fluminis]